MASTTETAGDRQQAAAVGWWPLAVIASAHLMAILDATIMFVALPSAQRAVGLPAAGGQWIVTAYTLAFAALLLVGGRLADRLGARRTLLAGVICFAAASAAGGAATTGAMLLSARAVQGAAAALLVSSTKSLLVTVYADADERSRAIGVFTATLTAGGALGLVLGGVLTTTLGWRWCLYVNVAVALIAIVGGPRALPAVPGRREIRIDPASAVLAAAGMAALVYGLGEASSAGWGSAPVAGSLAGAAVALAAFAIRQAGRPAPLLPLPVIADRNRGGALLAMIVNSLSTFGMLLILTYQLQTVLAYSALRTGLALLPFAVGAALTAAVIAPRLGRRLAPRWPITVGLLLSAAGLALLIAVNPGTRYLPLIFAATLVEGVGTGLGGPAILRTALAAVRPADVGAASAAHSTAGQLGSSIGAALLSTIAATTAAGYLAGHRAASAQTAADHGYAVALAWGVGILLAAAAPVALLLNAPAPRPATGEAAGPRAPTADVS